MNEIRQNIKELDFRKRVGEITSVIKAVLKEKYPSSLRFVDINGIELYDPNFILCGVSARNRALFSGKYGTYDPILTENSISSMTTDEVIDSLNQQYYGLGAGIQLAMFLTDGTRIPGSVNLARWLEINHYGIEDNIVVIPIALIKNGGKG